MLGLVNAGGAGWTFLTDIVGVKDERSRVLRRNRTPKAQSFSETTPTTAIAEAGLISQVADQQRGRGHSRYSTARFCAGPYPVVEPIHHARHTTPCHRATLKVLH